MDFEPADFAWKHRVILDKPRKRRSFGIHHRERRCSTMDPGTKLRFAQHDGVIVPRIITLYDIGESGFDAVCRTRPASPVPGRLPRHTSQAQR